MARLEHHQVLIYLLALVAGGVVGLRAPNAIEYVEPLIWPVLAVLIYSTFCQVRAVESFSAFRHGRFLTASLVANFAFVPLIVWLLSGLLPPNPAIKLGVFMVLLAPCTDWFVTFTHLARGDVRLAIAIVPIQFLAQVALLPLYLWAFVGWDFVGSDGATPFVQAFLGLIVLPFILATLTQSMAGRSSTADSWLKATAWLPVPLLALALLIVAASQVAMVGPIAASLGRAALVFVCFLVAAAPLAMLTARSFRLEPPAARTLVFNVGTRNSFVILPLALALPAGWEAAAAVVVLQGMIELLGMVGYLWAVPRFLIRRTQEIRAPG